MLAPYNTFAVLSMASLQLCVLGRRESIEVSSVLPIELNNIIYNNSLVLPFRSLKITSISKKNILDFDSVFTLAWFGLVILSHL